MSIGGKTLGQDISVVIVTPNGIFNITPDMVGKFTFKPVSDRKDWLPVTGVQENAVMPKAYSGVISLIRKNPNVEFWWAQFEAAYYEGVSIQECTITQTIKESNGSATQWLYTGVIFQLTDLGDYSGNEFVMQSLEWEGSRRLLVSGGA